MLRSNLTVFAQGLCQDVKCALGPRLRCTLRPFLNRLAGPTVVGKPDLRRLKLAPIIAVSVSVLLEDQVDSDFVLSSGLRIVGLHQ